MPLWQLGLDLVAGLLALVLLFGIGLILRRVLLSRRGGTFDVSYRVRQGAAGRGWLLGVGRYSGGHLEWFRLFSLSPRPKRVWDRADVEYRARRDPAGPEQVSLFAGHVVVTCDSASGVIELAMSPESLTGFQAWLEAMPPGSRGVRPGDSPTGY